MSNPEVILLAGPPGSGKSSIAERAVELDKPQEVRHLSIGDLKRSIVAGETPSAYAEMLQQREHPDRITGTAPSAAMTGIVEEFILAEPECLTILDGFPRYLDRVDPFKESMRRINATVLALCIVEIDESVILERLGQRPSREGQKIKVPAERIADHNENIVPTLELLGEDYPLYQIDGSCPVDENAIALLGIYSRHTAKP